MSRFKVTILREDGAVRTEIIDCDFGFPVIGFPTHYLNNGDYGIPVRIEMTFDTIGVDSDVT